MNSRLSSVTLSSLAAIAAAIALPAQCGDPVYGTAISTGYQDDAVMPMQSLGFAFPFNGSTYTDVHITTNGLMYLSNAGVPAPGGTGCCSGSTGTLVAGSPKIAPYWSDHVCDEPDHGSQIFFNAVPGRAVITWSNLVEYPVTSNNVYTFQVQLFATGEIIFTYDDRCQITTAGDLLVGMSEGGGAAVPAASDFLAGGASATTTTFELFTAIGSFDLAGQSVIFVPTSPGYAFVPQPCPNGSLESYGRGCYGLSDSFYQYTVDPVESSARLSNTGITLIPAGNEYVVIPGGTFVPPSGAATAMTISDDGQTTTPALTTPFPYPGGTASTLQVASNGMVWVATGNVATWTPDIEDMLTNPQTGWYAWHDYNSTAAGSGQIKFEEVGTIAYVTWDGVYNYGGTSAADASWLQFQFDTTTGQVVIAFGAVSANPSALVPSGNPHLVGYSPGGGASLDIGGIDFATQLPLTTSSTAQMSPLTLTGSGAAAVDNTVTYTLTNVPEFAPASGVYLSTLFYSVNPLPGGFDLGIIGAPGCSAWVLTLDVDAGGQLTFAPTASWNLTLSSGSFAIGNVFAAQGVTLIQPNSLPNGENAFGMVVSNGVLTTIGNW